MLFVIGPFDRYLKVRGSVDLFQADALRYVVFYASQDFGATPSSTYSERSERPLAICLKYPVNSSQHPGHVLVTEECAGSRDLELFDRMDSHDCPESIQAAESDASPQ